MFFSTLPSDYEKNLMDEIWGCVKYVGIPYDTVMRLPIQNRRYFIMRHNEDQERLNAATNGNGPTTSLYGEDVNMFSKGLQGMGGMF